MSGASASGGFKKFKMSSVVTVSKATASATQWKTVSSTAIKPVGHDARDSGRQEDPNSSMPKIPLNRIKLNSGMTPRSSVQAAPLSGQ